MVKINEETREAKIRLLRTNEIECRVSMISDKGLSLLLYKDVRVDMKILDEAYGSMGWQSRIAAINQELKRTGITLDAVLGRYGVSAIRDMPEATYRKAINSLKRTKSAQAA